MENSEALNYAANLVLKNIKCDLYDSPYETLVYDILFFLCQCELLREEATTASEIKPCPFCGAKAEVQQSKGLWFVYCAGYDCLMFPETDLCVSKKDAIEVWNRRYNE